MKSIKSIELTKPVNQLKLYGYKTYFDLFHKLDKKNKLPNSILLSGQKGLGKSTFAYHFINYLLSKDEKYKYDINNFTIDPNNSTYKLIQNLTHSNLFILDGNEEEKIKIEQIRKLLLFLSKSTYYKGIKVVLLDNAEYLNINSSNALLKSIEEPNKDTYFFIINNNGKKILNTIKSRCLDFIINFNLSQKKDIFSKICLQYDLSFTESDLDNFLYFDTHGNLLNYFMILNNSKHKISEDYLSSIRFFIEIYSTTNNPKILNIISLFIHKFYNQMSIKNGFLINRYYKNLNKIFYLIDDMKKYNLEKKNLIFSIDKIIKNER